MWQLKNVSELFNGEDEEVKSHLIIACKYFFNDVRWDLFGGYGTFELDFKIFILHSLLFEI